MTGEREDFSRDLRVLRDVANLFQRRRGEHSQHDQPFVAAIAHGVHDAGRGEGAASGRDQLDFVADLDLGLAFEHDVELVLAGVGVRGVFLAGFKTIQAGEQSFAARDVDLRHLLGGEFGESGEVLDDHYRRSRRRPVS